MSDTERISLPVDSVGPDDGLERSRFTRYILKVLQQVDAQDGVVVGLEGEWGSGKTWVLQQLKEVAKTDTPSLRFLEFNPWMLSGSDDLVAALLQQLGRQLGEQTKTTTGAAKTTLTKAVKAIDKYAGAMVAAKHLAPVANLLLPGAGLVLGGISAAAEAASDATRKLVPALPEAASKKSLPTLREEIKTALRGYTGKIIVIVDDLDRIPPAEVAAMVQAIKAVADFPNVVYLLAYEAGTLADALQESLRVRDGRAYLEKIVQVPIPLPELPARRMQPFAEKQLRLSLPTGVPEDQVVDIRMGVTIAAALVHTPRGVARLRTRLALVLTELREEVNLADVVVAEAICLVIPGWLEWMRNHESYFIEPGSGWYDPAQRARGIQHHSLPWAGLPEDLRKQEMNTARSEFQQLGTLHTTQRRVYKRALEFLFDRAFESHSETETRAPRRLQKHRFWYRWLCFCDQQEPISLEDMTTYALDPSIAKSDGWFSSPQAFEELCKQFADLAGEGLSSANAVLWAEAFVEMQDMFDVEVLEQPDYGEGKLAVLQRCLCFEQDTTRRDAALSLILSRASLSFCALLLIRSRQRMESGNPRPQDAWRQLFTAANHLKNARTQWMRRVKEYLTSDAWLSSTSKLSPMYLLGWAFHAGEPAANLRAESERLLLQSTTALTDFFGSEYQGVKETLKNSLEQIWEVLPTAERLADLVQKDESFKQSHPIVAEVILRKAQSDLAANQHPAPDPA